MRFDTKALLKLMKQSWRGGGVKIQRTEHRRLWDSFFITGAGWALLIPKENCPGEIAGQIVTWLADMPKIGESKWVVKGCDPQDIPEDDRTIDISRYTTGNYETGMACLPLCTATDALIQYGADDRAAAFPLDAFAVVQAGVALNAARVVDQHGILQIRFGDELAAQRVARHQHGAGEIALLGGDVRRRDMRIGHKNKPLSDSCCYLHYNGKPAKSQP